MYKSKELWRGPESIYTLKQGQCVAHDRDGSVLNSDLLVHAAMCTSSLH
jgi:hypothetical protein